MAQALVEKDKRSAPVSEADLEVIVQDLILAVEELMKKYTELADQLKDVQNPKTKTAASKG